LHRIGVISDIHANLPALEKALEILEEEGVDRIYACGDIVGYGESPNECCDRIRSLGCPVAAGNHDWAVAGLTEYEKSHTERAVEGIERTKQVIAKDNLRWLQNLPLYHKEDGMEFVHASLTKADQWHYLTRRHSFTDAAWHDVQNNFHILKGQVCFVGHSHQPTIFLEKRFGRIKVVHPQTATFELKGRRAIVDTGSVGLPRDASAKSSLVIYDRRDQVVHFRQFSLEGHDDRLIESAEKPQSVWQSTKRKISRIAGMSG
jgi:predicted phosphodiesterase